VETFVGGQAVEGQVEEVEGRSQAVHGAAGLKSVAQAAGSRIDSGRNTVELVEVM
jgi:hypothetical protein